MKKQLLILLFLILCNSISSAQETIKTFYKNCDTCIESELHKNSEGLFHGPNTFYYESGTISLQETYNNGVITSIYEFFSNGKRKYSITLYPESNYKSGFAIMFDSLENICAYGYMDDFEKTTIEYEETIEGGETLGLLRGVFLARKTGVWIYFINGAFHKAEKYDNNCSPKIEIRNLNN